MGDLLRVDLTSRTCTEETLSPDFLRAYIGSKGVGTHLLLQEVAPDVEPLSPQNKLIFCVGPLSGTAMPGTNRYAVYFLSPLTNGYGESYSGGKVASQFAKTGYKAVILEGVAESPVFLEVSESGVVFHPADHLWGMDAYQAEETLLASVGVDRAEACVIGPAGENLVRFASIQNNQTHILGRGGAGAVMGSKKVKGIVWHGSRKTEVARPEALRALVKDINVRGKDHPGTQFNRKFGTPGLVRMCNGLNMFPARYWQKGHLDDFEPLSAETMLADFGTETINSCPPCFLHCGKKNTVPDGHKLAGLTIEGPEYETIYVFGGLCEILDFAQVMRLNDLCDRLGMDTITAGNLAGLAIEACTQGRLDLGLDYGDADGVAELLRMIVFREGVGEVFADGILRVEKEFGLEDVAVHVKGMEPAGYDPRVSKGMGLGYAMTERGACHMRSTFFKAELSGLVEGGMDAVRDKAPVYVDWENRLIIMDTLIYCRFYRDFVEWPYLTEVVNAALGTEYSSDDLGAIANRIKGEAHEFNRRRGFDADKEKLPVWITTHRLPALPGETREPAITDEDVSQMRREYYEARGWPHT